MQIAILVNRTIRQNVTHTSLHLAFEAARRGHTVRYLNIDGFALGADGRPYGWTVPAPAVPADVVDLEAARAAFAAELCLRAQGTLERVDLTTMDVVFLRNNPAEHQVGPEAVIGNPALGFGRLLRAAGVLVLNDPDGIARFSSKMTLLAELPGVPQPRSVVAKRPEELRAFLRELRGPAIVKPLAGFGGEDVFFVAPDDRNRNAILTTVTRQGYAIAQEYLPDAQVGDRRLLLLDGEPLYVDGRPAIYARQRPDDDIRANLHVGGRGGPAEFGAEDARGLAPLAARLRAEGLYLVGVDLVGSRVLELNVHAPGGIHNVNRFQGINVGEHVVRDLESRVAARRAAAPGAVRG